MKFNHRVNKNLYTNFGEIENSDVVAEKVRVETVATVNDKTRITLKWRAVYTFLLNSKDTKFTRHMTHTASTYLRQGPLAWKIITSYYVKNDNQTIRWALYSAHTLNLDDFNYDVDKLISHIQASAMILFSSGKTNKSVITNIFSHSKKNSMPRICQLAYSKLNDLE